MIALTRKQVRRIDELVVVELGIPGLLLMENAGRSVAESAMDLIRQRRNIGTRTARAAVLCGGGNNGGDGYVVARHLHNMGVEVTVYPAVEPGALAGDAKVNAQIVRKMDLRRGPLASPANVEKSAAEWRQADVIIDALLGTGFGGPVRAPIAQMIDLLNAASGQGPAVIAVDLPSGLDCDTGQPAAPTVRADLTVTFVAPKAGFGKPPAGEYLGRVIVADIGAPPSLIERVLREK